LYNEWVNCINNKCVVNVYNSYYFVFLY
jgi:hypothetical protein